MNWEFLIDETTLVWLLPNLYAHYRRPLQEALILFLQRLPARRQEAIAVQQATLPSTAAVRTGWSCWPEAALCYTNWVKPWQETGISPPN